MTDQSWKEFDQGLRIRMEGFDKTHVVEHDHIGHRRNSVFLNTDKQKKLLTQKFLKNLEVEHERLTQCTKETIKTVVPKQ